MAVVRLGDWGTAPALRDLDSAAASGNRVFGLDRCELARPERLELPTLWFEARCSIQLSYGRTRTLFTINSLPLFLLQFQPPCLRIRISLIQNGLAKTIFRASI
jgi:hypothetical protein